TIVRSMLGRYRGVEVDTAGDGFFATFDGPACAIRCALGISEAVSSLGIEIRATASLLASQSAGSTPSPDRPRGPAVGDLSHVRSVRIRRIAACEEHERQRERDREQLGSLGE